MKLTAKILVMEDEPLVRLMICSALERAGAEVHEAGSCKEAVDLVRLTQLDAAVFDYRLPDGDGLDVVRQLRCEGFGLPVVLMSGESVELAGEAAKVGGIAAVLPKPPDADQLLEAVANALGSGRTAEEVQVGRYAYWKVCSADEPASPRWIDAEWLAVDLSDLAGAGLGSPVIDCLNLPRRGTVVMGADAAQCAQLETRSIQADFVLDKDELIALSRRSSSPMERDFLLESVIQRPGAPSHA